MLPFKEVDRPIDHNLSEIALKSGFKFRDIENRRLDWKTLGCVDVNKVIENQDFEFLEKITPKIIEAPMQSILNSAALDPAVSSLFRLAQMSLQYLSFCQQFMSHTLYDLRTAFNLLQKKYAILKQNYKCIEEQHYKAQERIQLLLNENRADQSVTQNHKPVSLYPCDKCTKNFLTADSLKSHQQRKHSAIEEKHELSDDNEKGEFNTGRTTLEEGEKSQQNTTNLEPEALQSDNNNESESSANCEACSQRKKTNSTSVAIQCDETTNEAPLLQAKNNVATDEGPHEQSNETTPKTDGKTENDLIGKAHQTIIALKKEIEDLKNSFDVKPFSEKSTEFLDITKNTNLVQTNDKINVIERKFNAFETMYMESQDKFIESFRSLDERQKVYMDNIQETIKEIVEKSLGHHEEIASPEEVAQTVENNNVNGIDNEDETEILSKNDIGPQPTTKNEEPPQLPKPSSPNQILSTDSYSQSDGEGEENKLICQVDVHTVSSAETNLVVEEQNPKKSAKARTRAYKDMALNEFEQRLNQLGVDADSTGLTTPRSCEVYQDLAEEREEMKKAHKSFDMTRKKLRNEVNRIAKEKLASASSVTSLSSASYQSDDQVLNEIGKQAIEKANTRPKSASVQKMRNRNAKKYMRKVVENDIDENDIMDKMQLAQKAINAHRECIQELLQTTAHSPSTVTKIKYPATSKREESKPQSNDTNTNQYDKMPNITTRRVVFVNLDEDS